MRRVLVLLALIASIAAPRAAAAQEAGRVTIALIPFEGERRLALYGQPVASEITRALREAGLDVTLVTGAVPSRARLVVSGRIVRRGNGVVLEGRVRDPERGEDVARPSSSARTVGDIDQAAAALAAALVPAIRGGLSRQDAEAAKVRDALVPPVPPVAVDNTRPAPPVPVDRRPLALVVVLSAKPIELDGAAVPAASVAAPALIDLAARIGHRAIALDAHSPEAAKAARDAQLVITVELLSLSLAHSRDIPLGRARVRVTVTTPAGDPLYRRVVRTDTLVGSRGDRIDTLVRLAAAQVTDVVAPRLRERLAVK